MLPCQPFLAFYIWGAHWRRLKNMTEPSMCGGDAALCQITLTTCFLWSSYGIGLVSDIAVFVLKRDVKLLLTN